MLTCFFADYWDSYWIVQGLLKSELYDTVNDTLQNFMDEIQNWGFIPNGGRTYCERSLFLSRGVGKLTRIDLNRSQPPLFIHVSTKHSGIEWDLINCKDAF